jgi:two-component system sensor histidine kinase KdpD
MADEGSRARLLPAIPRSGLGPHRVGTGLVLAVLLPPALLFLLLEVFRSDLPTASLVELTGAVLVAIVGGIWPALIAALWSSLLLNWFLTTPTGTLHIDDPASVAALLLFLLVSGAVAAIVDVSARRSAQARTAAAEAGALRDLALVAVAAEDPVAALLDQARTALNLESAALLARTGAGWRTVAAAGQAPSDPSAADHAEDVDPGTVLALTGRPLSAADRRLAAAFAAQVTGARTREQLLAKERENLRLTEDNRMRTSILRAVSHDLRTPLAGIRLAVDSLLEPRSRLSQADRAELLRTTQAYSDQLALLVENLLDMSRISSDAVRALARPVDWSEVLPRALRAVPPGTVRLELQSGLAPVAADPGLLERVVANLAENAARHAPESPITLTAREGEGWGELRIADAGSARLPADLDELFRPFQRTTDSGAPAGVGLGLAVARGLAEAMGGSLRPERTPGGGLTMVIRMPLAAPVAPGSPEIRR